MFRSKFIAWSLLFLTALPLAANAEQVFVRNQPYKGQTLKQGGSLLVEFQALVKMLELKVTPSPSGAWVLAGTASPDSAAPGTKTNVFLANGQEVQLVDKNGTMFVSLEQIAEPLGLKVVRNAQLDSVDVYAARAGAQVAAAPATVDSSPGTAAANPARPGSLPADGTPFHNAELGIDFVAPKDYALVVNQETLKREQASGESVMTEAGKKVLHSANVGLQFRCSHQGPPLGAMVLATEALPYNVSLDEYLELSKKNLAKGLVSVNILSTGTDVIKIGGVDFKTIEATFTQEGQKLYDKTFVAVDPGRKIAFTIGLIAPDIPGIHKLERLLDRLRFSPA